MDEIQMSDLFDEWFLGRSVLEVEGAVTYMECKRCGALVRDGYGESGNPTWVHLEFHRRLES